MNTDESVTISLDSPVADTIKVQAPPRPMIGSVAARQAAKAAKMAKEATRAEPTATKVGRLKRNRKGTADQLYIDPRIIPAGMTYEWKRMSTYGRKDESHYLSLKDNHWTEVPQSRHPNQLVEMEGLRLMERPDYLTEEAYEEGYDNAIAQLRTATGNMSQTPGGTFTRDHPSVQRVSGVRVSYGNPVSEE